MCFLLLPRPLGLPPIGFAQAAGGPAEEDVPYRPIGRRLAYSVRMKARAAVLASRRKTPANMLGGLFDDDELYPPAGKRVNKQQRPQLEAAGVKFSTADETPAVANAPHPPTRAPLKAVGQEGKLKKIK